jgi:WhiB family redox-sensing transcriptional regulator
MCALCPVQRACLDYAIGIREPHGVWGGLNEVERKQILERRAG